MNGVNLESDVHAIPAVYIGAFPWSKRLRSLIHSRPEAWMCDEDGPSGKPTGSAGRCHRRGQSSRWQARARWLQVGRIGTVSKRGVRAREVPLGVPSL
jgi:hypothetical protein